MDSFTLFWEVAHVFNCLLTREVIIILNNIERDILNVIRQHPNSSQEMIADYVNESQEVLSVSISNLVQRGYLCQHPTYLTYDRPIICIGGMNVDRKFYAEQDLILKTSNPVNMSVSVGGVSRNIAENLGRLGEAVVMLSRAGEDQDWKLIHSTSSPYMMLDQVDVLSGQTTSSYTAVIDRSGEMSIALANMSICDTMTVSWLKEHEDDLLQAKALITDLNLPKETLRYLIDLAREYELALAVVPVSAPKMNRLPRELSGIEWLIVNQDESEYFFDQQAHSEEEIQQLADLWLACGVKQVLITRGSQSMFYANQSGQRVEVMPKSVTRIADVTGAGDALASGVFFGWVNQYSIEDILSFGVTNAYYTILSQDTVRDALSRQTFLQERKELFSNEH